TSSSRMESRLSINQTGTPLERHTPDLTITQLDESFHVLPLSWRDAMPATAGMCAGGSQIVGLFWTIAAPSAIAANFSGNGAWAAIQCAGNLPDRMLSTQHGPNLVTFLSGEVRIAHRATPTWWLECRC